MLSKCANPACGTPFRYLREGRLFKFDLRQQEFTSLHLVEEKEKKKELSRKVEHFWLCGRCSTDLTLAVGSPGEVMVVPRRHGPKRAHVRRAVAS